MSAFRKKNRVAVITAGAAPGLTNLLVARASALMDSVDAVYIRLYESIESDDPISQWSAEVSFDEAISLPRIVRDGRFRYGKRFGEPEKFRFPPPIGETTVVLAAQDEVGTVPYFLKLNEMDVKIGGNEIDRLRRWYRQGKLSKSRGLVASRFPKTPSPRQVARMIRQGKLQNARFAAAVIVRGDEAGPADRNSLRRNLPFALSNPPARPGSLAGLLRHGTDGFAVHQTFSARFGRSFSSRRDPTGEPASDLQRPESRAESAVTMKITKKKPSEDEEEF